VDRTFRRALRFDRRWDCDRKVFLVPNPSLYAEFRFDKLQYPESVGAQPNCEIMLTENGIQSAVAPPNKPLPEGAFPLHQLQGRWLGYIRNTGNVALANVTLYFDEPLAYVRIQRLGFRPNFVANQQMLEIGSLQPGERVAVGAWERYVPENERAVFIANDQEYLSPSSANWRRNPLRLTHSMGVGTVRMVNYGSTWMELLRTREALAIFIMVGLPAIIASSTCFALLLFFRRIDRAKTA